MYLGRSTSTNVDSPNLGFTYFNFFKGGGGGGAVKKITLYHNHLFLFNNKVMKEVVREQKKEDFTWWSSIRSLTDRRLVAVLGITLMVRKATTNKNCFFLTRYGCLPFYLRNKTGASLWNISGDGLPGRHLWSLFDISSRSPSCLLILRQ